MRWGGRPRPPRKCLAFALILALPACWADPPQPQPVIIMHATPTAMPSHPAVAHATWAGSYTCAQGMTAVTLEIDTAASGGAHATFAFGPLGENRAVPRGSYRMTGSWHDDHGGHTLVLHPAAWLEQPPGYIMVGLTVSDDGTPDRLHGHMDDASCGGIELTLRSRS